MVKLKDYTTQAVKTLLPLQLLKRMRERNLTADQFKCVIIQKYFIASFFTNLLMSGIKDSIRIKDTELANVLTDNLKDELGIDKTGLLKQEESHSAWYADFLKALKLYPEQFNKNKLLNSTKQHIAALENLQKNGNLFSIVGALLILERIIPLEYRAMRENRDDLFPEIFVISDSDSDEIRKEKKAACRYIDDHIIHDAKEHFPQLLETLNKYQDNKEAFKEIKKGIDIIVKHRAMFYEDINLFSDGNLKGI